MADPFLGEIRYFGFNFAPRGWAECSGQILSIAQNTALFSLLGTTYGGNGQTTFALPDLRGTVGIGQSQGPGLSNIVLGERGGEAIHTIALSEMPAHSHSMQASSAQAVDPGNDPQAGVFAMPSNKPGRNYYGAPPTTTAAPGAIQATGGSQPHENRQPYLVVLAAIALQGIFPSRN